MASQSIVAGVNHILGPHCKGAVGKKDDKILAGAIVNSAPIVGNFAWPSSIS